MKLKIDTKSLSVFGILDNNKTPIKSFEDLKELRNKLESIEKHTFLFRNKVRKPSFPEQCLNFCIFYF